VSRSLKRLKVSFNAIDRLFISHLHADHCGGFLMFLQSCWLEKRRKPLPVHLPGEGIAPFRNMQRTAYLFDDLLPFELSMHRLRSQERIDDGSLQVVAHPTSHLQRLRHDFAKRYNLGFEAFCFEIRVGNGKRLGYSADLGAPEDLEPLVAQPLDVLIVELAHFSDAALFKYLQDKPIGRIVLTHVGRKYWKNEKVIQTARRYLDRSRVIIARDGLELGF
jgi:ribonuclease BN (tRNA processing enzyme)